MKRITATLAGVALVIPALVAVAPAASAATSRDYFVAKSGGRTHCRISRRPGPSVRSCTA